MDGDRFLEPASATISSFTDSVPVPPLITPSSESKRIGPALHLLRDLKPQWFSRGEHSVGRSAEPTRTCA